MAGKNRGKRITIKDIAAMAGVSIGTVDRVLHNRGEVNPDTHTRVMSFVETLGYTPNRLAKSLALKKSYVIAVLIPSANENNQYWRTPLKGFLKAAEELSDYNTKIDLHYYNLQEEASFIREFNQIIRSAPNGMILAPNFQNAASRLIPECNSLNIPLILIDNYLDEPCLAYFGQDSYQSGVVGGRLMNYGLRLNEAVLIVNLAVNKAAITRHMQKREQGFTDFFGKVNPSRRIKTVSTTIDLSSEGEPGKTLDRLLSSNPEIAGIFVTNSKVNKVAEFLSMRKSPHTMLIGYDLLEANRELMEKGIIDYLLCQKPEEQGYYSAKAMFDYLLTGKKAQKINYSPIDIVVRENMNYYNN